MAKSWVDAVRAVHDRGIVRASLLAGIRAKGYMDCGSPPWDPHTAHRIAAEGNEPVIQRLTAAGEWERAPLTAPQSVLAPKLAEAVVAPLDVSVVSDPAIRAVLEQLARELVVARRESLFTSAIVLAGAIGEGVLFDALVQRKSAAQASTKAPKSKSGALDLVADEWKLVSLIEVAEDIGLLSPNVKQMAHSVRDFRNMVHPKKQATSGARADEPEMNGALAWLEAVLRDVRAAP